MGVTAIVEVRNLSSAIATIQNFETPSDTADSKGVFQPGEVRKISIWIPQCTSAADFPKKHIQVVFSGGSFSIWQAEADQFNPASNKVEKIDRVRLSKNGKWSTPGEEIGGFAWVGGFLAVPVYIGPYLVWVGGGDRGLFITDTGLIFLPQELVDAVTKIQLSIAHAGYKICDELQDEKIESVPKLSASCFSMAGIPSDAFRQGKAGSRFLYRDSGKRYEFTVKQAAPVTVSSPDGSSRQLTQAITYHHSRKLPGETVPLPEFDLIAADGGRVFAKQKGSDRFFFATLDEMFIHADPSGREFPIPSIYFKLDPEFNHAGRNVADLLAHLQGNFAGHPATLSYPVYRAVLRLQLLNFMVVSVQPFKWHQLDVRPPAGLQALAECVALPVSTDLAISLLGSSLGLALLVLRPLLLRTLASVPDLAAKPPFGTSAPPKTPTSFCPADTTLPKLSPAVVTYRKVLDIGVGHVHLHQQYELITGGELQPVRVPPGNPVNDALKQYQYINGPVRDGDGYIDGTCNYYALVQLKTDAEMSKAPNDAFALLYTDEQSYFSGRWRLVHPDDFLGGLTALVSKLHDDATRDPSSQLFHFERAKYWCPFRSGLIGPASRLAVSAQVLLVSGDKDIEPGVIYSINFSWATLDRTWRWRRIGGNARFFTSESDQAAEVIATDQANCFYPQTLRLRGDMTIHIKGTGDAGKAPHPVGRWCQKYLPPSNSLDPPAASLIAGKRPAASADRKWKFFPEAVFHRADQFSHFGVYDVVDSRCQYYPLQVTPEAATVLQSKGPGPWTDDQNRLAIAGPRQFSWDDLRYEDPAPIERKSPASLFNPATMLKIVQRGPQWIAMHWDKRDDDLMPFNIPAAGLDVHFTNGGAGVQVKIMPNVLREGPPAVEKAFFWTSNGRAWLAYTRPIASSPFDNVSRVRMAALSNNGQVISLLDLRTNGNFKFSNGFYQYEWTPTAAELAAFNTHASDKGVLQSGTSLWFEDIVGHVATPEELHWTFPPIMNVKMVPAEVPAGVQVSVTVHAQDLTTGQTLKGKVLIDNEQVANTDQAFDYTFTRAPRQLPPRVLVVVDGYPDTEVPWKFSSLRVWVEQPALSFGVPAQVMVHAADGETQAAVAGRVKINAIDIEATNRNFSFTFPATAPAGVVSAPGYPDTPIPWPPLRPALLLAMLEPAVVPGQLANYIVHVSDANSRMQVDGTVTIGTFTAQTNTGFSYKFVFQRIRRFDPETRTWVFDEVLPAITVKVPGYPDAQFTPETPDPAGTK